MAKLKAPLFSHEARGAIAESLVYFPWKGIACVRKWVSPTNPKTTFQTTQRGWLTEAVAGVHTSQQAPAHPLDEEDETALALLGSLQPTPRTWFNTQCKTIIDQRVAGKNWAIFSDMHCTPAATQLTVQGFVTASVGGDPTTGNLWYGTSKSALINSLVCTVADLATGKAIPGLTNGTKYFVQYRPTTDAAYVGSNSGIYYGTPAA